MRPRPGLACGLLAVLVLAACARAVAPIGAAGRPFAPDDDERTLWAEAEREATAILARVRLHDDPALAGYLAQLGERLLPEQVRTAGGPALRYHVVRDPTLNAFALPPGRVLLHTGLLAAVETEAQLALILAREIGHVSGRHALVAARQGRLAPVRYGGAAVLSPTAAAILGSAARLACLAALTGYDERLERRADAAAVEALGRAGWDAAEAADVYRLVGERAAGAGALERFRYGTPAWLEARYRELGRRSPPAMPGSASPDAFQAHRAGLLRENALEDLRAGRLHLAALQLARLLSNDPGDVTARLYAGELHRLRAQQAPTGPERETALAEALDHYTRALALAPERADLHRQVGLLFYQQGDRQRAAAALQEYLRLAPDAADALRVAEYVRELAR